MNLSEEVRQQAAGIIGDFYVALAADFNRQWLAGAYSDAQQLRAELYTLVDRTITALQALEHLKQGEGSASNG